MTNYRLLLFDLDGTLTESAPGIIQSIRYALDRMGIDEADPDQLYTFIGPPLMESFQRVYGLSDEKAWQAVQFYREYFAARGMFENSLYPGISSLVPSLCDHGYRLVVVTSKPQVYAEKILDHFQLRSHFERVVGSNLDGTLIEKSDLIAHVLNIYPDQSKESFLMIGDRRYDVEGARANGVDAAAVGYGYGSRKELTQSHPRYYLETVDELKDLFL